MQTINEPARETPVVEDVDVLIAGGGPAGVAAAYAAARQGARVRLIEAHGQLGGIWTTGLLSWILDVRNKGGVLREIFARLDAMGARGYLAPNADVAYDVEAMKLVLEEVCLEAGVQIRLHSRIVAAARDASNRLAVAITESKSGREAFAARVFVDCTGDGDLAAHAGCAFDLGRPAGDELGEPGEMQPMSMIALLGGVSYARLYELGYARGEGMTNRQAGQNLRERMMSAGVEPSYGNPSLFRIRDDLMILMSNHEYGRSGINAQDLTDATLAARRELHQTVTALRNSGKPFENLQLVATAGQIGVREGRRIRGRYTVDLDDLLEGRRHDDAVCRVTFGIDVHSTRGDRSKGFEKRGHRTQPYDIPYRALIAKDVDGLLMAGRCISGDFLAHSSYRVTGNAVALGEAAGTAAAVAAKRGVLPHELDFDADLRSVWTPPIVDASARKDLPTRQPS